MSADWKFYLGIAAGLLGLAEFALYNISIVRGKTTPNRVTWWIWVFVQLGATYLFWDSSPENRFAIWVGLGYTLGTLGAAILSLKYGEKEWSWVDCVAIVGVLLAIGSKAVFGSMSALLVLVVVDTLGALPTMVKSHKKPRSEDLVAWAIGFIANTVNLFALGDWETAAVIYPIYLALQTGLVTALLVGGRIRERTR